MRRKILAWYRKNGRHDLPWRHTNDPYHILVSEIMLQQTQVSRVVPKYQAFLKTFPTIQRLAQAPTQRLLKQWSGLGYNRRALNLRTLAQVVVRECRSTIPSHLDQLLELPGIGPYTAAAIVIFAFNKNEVTVDTNVRRVLIHELGLPETISIDSLRQIARHLVPKGKSRIWHSALMDYGAGEATARTTKIKSLSQQPKFAGSNRYYRGAVIRTLHQTSKVSITRLAREVALPVAKLKPILNQLARDGFLGVKGRTVRLVG